MYQLLRKVHRSKTKQRIPHILRETTQFHNHRIYMPLPKWRLTNVKIGKQTHRK